MLPLLLLPVALAAPEISVGAGYARTTYYEDFGSYKRPMAELSALLRWEAGWELEAGGRWIFYGYSTAPPLEGFVAGRAAPAIGPWRPTLGLELGVTGALYRDYPAISETNYGPGKDYSEVAFRDTVAPVYVQVTSEPLRFRVKRFSATVGGVSIGRTIPGLAAVTRLELTWARLEVALW
ncbi:MAG: hypothetical protein H6739_28760 [Alphaproteobacteria bacterium]|nr:hypothetical protein [Alphaproteobacteria bacterium]